MHDQQLGALGGGQFEQLGVSRHAAGDGPHVVGTDDLKAVGAVVLKARRFEQPVDLLEYLLKGHGHRATIPPRPSRAAVVWNTGRRVGA